MAVMHRHTRVARVCVIVAVLVGVGVGVAAATGTVKSAKAAVPPEAVTAARTVKESSVMRGPAQIPPSL